MFPVPVIICLPRVSSLHWSLVIFYQVPFATKITICYKISYPLLQNHLTTEFTFYATKIIHMFCLLNELFSPVESLSIHNEGMILNFVS